MIRKPTLKDVAGLADTSTATASVVLNKVSHKYVSDELRERVLEAARELNYRPNIAARRLKGKTGKTLAILVPQFENTFFNRVVIGAETHASERGYILSIYSTQDKEEKELQFLQNIISHQVDGILICPANNQSRSVEVIQEAGIPYVVIDRAVQGDESDYVTIDNYQAAYVGTKSLIEHGHRRILYYGWKSDLNTITDRILGFEDALAEAGISPDEYMVVEGNRSRSEVFEIYGKLLKERDFTAVFAGHNHIGEAIIESLRVAGKRIPADVSVLIFGNPSWAVITLPSFSCIAQPDLEMGTKAAELIISLVENPKHAPSLHTLEARLLKRDSVLHLNKSV